MARIHLLRLIAIVPVLVAAIVNTGYQYLVAVDLNGGAGAGDWRERVAGFLKIDHSNLGAYDILVAGLVHLLPVFAMAFLTVGLWERIFSHKRNLRFDVGVIYTALLFSLLMPPGVSFFSVVFGMSFAMVFAHGIFGGEGKAFLNPALVGAAVLQISFPSALADHPLWVNLNGYAGTRFFSIYHQQGTDSLAWVGPDWWDAFLGSTQGLIGTTSVFAVLIGAAVLIYGHIASWRLLAGQLIGVIVVTTICNVLGGGIMGMPWYWHLVLGGFAFTAVFIATDPSSSSSTNAGRWVQGIMIGALIVFMRVANPSHPDSVIPVVLLASMLAPLIDHVVMWFNIRRRSLRHGA